MFRSSPVITHWSHSEVSPKWVGFRLSEWQIKEGLKYWHHRRWCQSITWLPSIGKAGSPSDPCNAFQAHLDLHLCSLYRAPCWNSSFQSSFSWLLWTTLLILWWKKPSLLLFLYCLKSCVFWITHTWSSGQCNASTMCCVRISLACWINDAVQHYTDSLFFFTAVLPSILSIHSPSACMRFTYFTSIDMVKRTLLTHRFVLLIGIQHKWELSTCVCPQRAEQNQL